MSDSDSMLMDQLLRLNVTHYDLLGLPKAASMLDVKKDYKKLALRFHPDKYRGDDKERATKAFQVLNNVYEVLGDEVTKQRYDRTLPSAPPSSSSTASANTSSSAESSGTAEGSTEDSLPAWLNFGTIFTSLTRSFSQAPEHFDSQKNTDRYRSMAVFLRVVKDDVNNTSDEFVNQAGGLILTAFADVFVDVLPFVLRAYQVKNAAFVYAVSTAAAFGLLMAKDEIVKMFEWNTIDKDLKVIVIDSLIDYYRNKTAFRW